MDTTAVLVALLSLALAYFAFRSVLDHRNLSHFGGPLLASSSSCWLFWQSAAGRLSQAEGEAIERYGVQLSCRRSTRVLTMFRRLSRSHWSESASSQ